MKTEPEAGASSSRRTVAISGICRTCMNTGSSSEALIPIGAELEENARIASVIGELTAVDIREDDDLPKQICGGCLDELKRHVGFIRTVRSCDRKLRKILRGGGEIKIERDDEAQPSAAVSVGELDLTEKTEVLDEEVVYEEYLDSDNDVLDWTEQKEEDEGEEQEEPAEDSSAIEFVGLNANKTGSDDGENRLKRKRKRTNKPNEDDQPEDVLDEVEQELYIVHEVMERDYFCCGCNNIFTDQEEFREHCQGHKERAKVNALKVHVCEICSRRFTTAKWLERHRNQTQNPSKVYECRRCQQRYINPETRRNHAHNHPEMSEPKSAHCCAKGCTETFANEELLMEHAQQAHRSKRLADILPGTGDKPYECPICLTRLHNKDSLRNHRRRRNQNSQRQCSICGQHMIGIIQLTNHERMHRGERPFQCSQCPKAFVSSSQLKGHMLAHQTEKPYICSVCGKGFTRKDSWQKHELIHTDHRMFECEVCDKKFLVQTRLTKHMRSHTGDKPYQCRYCDKTFADHSNRQRHEMGHTGIKPYKCSQCDKTFITKRLQADHERSNHAIVTVFPCSVCVESFTTRKSLNKHMQSVHDELV